MREKKGVKPTLKQHQKAEEAKETMGHLNEKKQKLPKENVPNFWQNLLRDWNRLSKKKKIGIIIAGLITLGIAPNIISGLAVAFYDMLSSTANNLRSNKVSLLNSKLARAVPELVIGTTEHTTTQTNTMTKGVMQMYDAVASALQKPYEHFVLLVGGSHTENFWETLWLTTVLSAYRDFQKEPINFTFVQEFGAAQNWIDGITLVNRNFKSLHAGDINHFRKLGFKDLKTPFFQFLQAGCLDHSKTPNPRNLLTMCPILGMMSYNFNLVLAENLEKPLTAAQQKFMRNYQKHRNGLRIVDLKNQKIDTPALTFPFKTTETDAVLLDTLKKHIPTRGKSVTVAFMGGYHLQAVHNGLQAAGITPSLMLNLVTDPTSMETFSTREAFATRCIKPIEKCSPKHKSHQYSGVTHCLESESYNSKECDEGLHEKYDREWENKKFLQSKHVVQIPHVLSGYPLKHSAFFLPAETHQKLRERFIADEKTQAETTAPTPSS